MYCEVLPMRKFTLTVIVLLSMVLTGGCGKAIDSPATTTAHTNGAADPLLRARDDVELLHETEMDGLVLRVHSPYQQQFKGEVFTITATVTNTTDHDIFYGVGSGTPNMHNEIRVTIEPGFIDMDTYGKIQTDDYKYATLRAGETFEETIRFLPGVPKGAVLEIDLDSMNWFPADEYTGSAVFTWYTGASVENPGEMKELRVEFPAVVI